jgi:hypothetical protein
MLGTGNSYGTETGWTDSTGGFSGLDNGFRYGLSVPSYQVSTLNAAGLSYGLRTTPDVSFNADPNTGYAVYDSVPYSGTSGWFDVGGTSAAAPAWAGLVAITDQGLVASGKSTLTTTQLLSNLYSLPSSDFQDITAGFNGYYAGTGYDLVTGLGTPKANLLVPDLLAANGVQMGSGTKPAAAPSQQATNSSVVHNVVVGSTSSTPAAGVVAMMTVTASFSAGISALPSPSLTVSTTTGSPGAATQTGATGIGSSATSAGVPVGLGQGTSSSSILFASGISDSGEEPGSAIDVVDAGVGVDTLSPESPMPQAPTPEMPMPQPLPPDEIPRDPGPGSSPESMLVIPSWDSLDSTLRGVDAVIARLVSGAAVVRIESDGEAERVVDIRTAAEDGGAASGLVAAGAVVALGQRVLIGRGRRRTSRWSSRSTGR